MDIMPPVPLWYTFLSLIIVGVVIIGIVYLIAFNIRIYDPDNNIVWSENNVINTYFSVKALKSGVHRVEVQNPNPEAIECHVQIAMRTKVTYRPLDPLGQWLSLTSLPTFGLGIWASGALAAMQKGGRP